MAASTSAAKTFSPPTMIMSFFLIIACEIAGAEKSLAVDVDERFLQLARLAPIALYDVLSGEQQFADFARGAFLQIFIDDQWTDERERFADGIGPFERVFSVENMRGGNGFREAEEVVEIGLREFRLQHADGLDGHEGARVADDAEGGEVVVVQRGESDDALQDRGDRQEGRDLLRLDELEERFGLRFGGDDDGRALRGGGGEGAVKRRAVEHRIDEQMDVRRDEALRGDGGHHVENQIAMAHDGAFWGGCRSGRVHDDARVLGGDFDRVESVALFEKRLERNELRRVFNGDDGEVRPPVDGGEGLLVVCILDDVWFDGVENRHEGIGLEPRINGHDNAADFDERPIDEIVFKRIRQTDGDGWPCGFRGFLQSCGEFFAERVRFGVGEPFVKADGCKLVRGGLEGVVPEFTGGFEIVGKHVQMWVEVAVGCEKRMVCAWD